MAKERAPLRRGAGGGRQMRIDVVLDVKTTLGEGPLWDADQQQLYWVDSFDGRVFRATEDGRELRAWDVPQKIGSMALRKDGAGAVRVTTAWVPPARLQDRGR